MLSPHRINPNITNKRTKKASITSSDNDSHTNYDAKRPQLTTNEPIKNKKNKFKGGTNNEINEHY